MAIAITRGCAAFVSQQAPICDQSDPHRYESDPVAGCPGYDIRVGAFLKKLGVEEEPVAGVEREQNLAHQLRLSLTTAGVERSVTLVCDLER